MAYNENKLKNFLVQEQCEGRTTSKIITPRAYTPSQFDGLYSEEYFLELYFKVRLMEEETQFSTSESKTLIRDCLQIHSSHGVSESLNKFERIVNKTLDYRGSLSYIKESLESREMEQD